MVTHHTLTILKALIPYKQLLVRHYGNISFQWKELYQELCSYGQILAINSKEEIFASDLEHDLYNLLKGMWNPFVAEEKPLVNRFQYSYKYLIHAKYQLSHAIISAIADLYEKEIDNIHIVVDNERLALELFYALKSKISLVNSTLNKLLESKYQLLPPTGAATIAQNDLAMFIVDIATLLFEETPQVQLLFYLLKSKRNKFSSLTDFFKASKLHGIPLSSLSYLDALRKHSDLANNPMIKIIDEAFLQTKSLSAQEKVHLWFIILQQLIVFYDEGEKSYFSNLYNSILDILANHNIEHNFLQWLLLNIEELEKSLYLTHFAEAKKTIQFVKSASLIATDALIVVDIDYNGENNFSSLNAFINQAQYCYFINSDYDENINNITDIVLSTLGKETKVIELKDLLHIENAPGVETSKGFAITKDLLPQRLFATSIGLLMKNPKEFFIQHILHLKPLDEFGRVPLKKMLGISMHEAIEQASTHKSLDIWEAKLYEAFVALTANALEEWDAKYYHHIVLPEVAEGIVSKLNLEATGYNEHYIVCDLTLPNNHKISIAMIVDRMELEGEIAKVIDYKTGIVPSNSAVLSGMEPQLLLAKFILQDKQYGIFDCNMAYIKVLPRVIDKNIDYKYMCYDVEEQLKSLLNHYFVEENPFS